MNRFILSAAFLVLVACPVWAQKFDPIEPQDLIRMAAANRPPTLEQIYVWQKRWDAILLTNPNMKETQAKEFATFKGKLVEGKAILKSIEETDDGIEIKLEGVEKSFIFGTLKGKNADFKLDSIVLYKAKAGGTADEVRLEACELRKKK